MEKDIDTDAFRGEIVFPLRSSTVKELFDLTEDSEVVLSEESIDVLRVEGSKTSIELAISS